MGMPVPTDWRITGAEGFSLAPTLPGVPVTAGMNILDLSLRNTSTSEQIKLNIYSLEASVGAGLTLPGDVAASNEDYPSNGIGSIFAGTLPRSQITPSCFNGNIVKTWNVGAAFVGSFEVIAVGFYNFGAALATGLLPSPITEGAVVRCFGFFYAASVRFGAGGGFQHSVGLVRNVIPL